MGTPGRQAGGTRGGDYRCADCGTRLAADNTARLCSKCHRQQRDQLDAPPQLKDDFFDTDEFRAAFQSWHIGKVFKAYRNHPRHLHLYGKPLNQELLGRWLGLGQGAVSKIENADEPEQNNKLLRTYAQILQLPPHMLWFKLSPDQILLNPSGPADTVIVPASRDHEVEQLRHRLQDLFTGGDVSSASVDDWELIVTRYGRATKDQPATLLLGDLAADIAELERTMEQCRSLSALRRLTRAAANLAA